MSQSTIPLKPMSVQIFGSWDKAQPSFIKPDIKTADITNLRHALKLVNYDELFYRSPDAIIVNTNEILSANLSKEFVNKICSCNDGDIGFVPSCDCRELTGLFYQGTICPTCKTEVTTAFVDKLAHSVWIDIPEHFPPFIHPIWYNILDSIPGIGTRNSKLMSIILDTESEVPEYLERLITGKGFRWFYENHKRVLEGIFNMGGFPKNTRIELARVKKLYERFGDCLFYRKIPILHKELHPVLSTDNNVKQADRTSKEILDVVYDMTALILSKRNHTTNSATFNKNFLKIYKAILTYHRSIIDSKLGNKWAIIRHHCLGTRMHWSYRSVIVPIQGVHAADELELPWALCVNMFKLHILNKLMRRGYTINDAIGIHMRALIAYDKLIDEIFEEIIAECPWKGPALLLGRNPKDIFLNRVYSRALWGRLHRCVTRLIR